MKERMISKEDVEYVAKLAKIELSEEQKNIFLVQFNDILFYFKKLNELNTEHTEPTSYIFPTPNRFHEDVPRPSLSQEMVVGLTRNKMNGYIKVPRIL
ncbi:MAG: Asp-tRNA(Asn)/Glu-tRNA(Gln) amidotransferase subunit GatC [Candidatus Aminicenantes bacterium]|nr:Asp-tRNA(Asn)/Glu-tRNA(Gln) amidotransferase subunit GatC [Candidatus Aminicenantes bacterium]